MAQEKVANLLHTFTVSAIISIVATGLLLTEPTQHAALTMLIWMFALSYPSTISFQAMEKAHPSTPRIWE